MDKWTKFSERLSAKYHSEAELEGRFEDCLYFILKWKPGKNITRQESIQFGHSNKRADLILKKDDKSVAIIELKRQGSEIRNHELGQLFSYMRQTYCKFGFLVGERLSLYYDPQTGIDPRRVLNISFSDQHNNDGETLMQLLTFESFDQDKLEEFCINYLESLEKAVQSSSAGGSVPNIDNLANYTEYSKDIENKIDGLVSLYENWITTTPSEIRYMKSLRENSKWLEENLLHKDIGKLSSKDFIELFEETSKRLSNQTRFINMRFRDEKDILKIRNDFEKALEHLSAAPKSSRFSILDDFLSNGEYEVWGLKKGFWSELVRVKFPDVPLFNDKTENFFNTIGLFIGDTYEEKQKTISRFYSDISNRHENMTILKLSHLEHFAWAKNAKNQVGLDYISRNFNNT